VETANAFLNRQMKFRLQDCFIAVFWKLEIVDASHDARKVVVGGERRLMRFADDGERRIKSTEA